MVPVPGAECIPLRVVVVVVVPVVEERGFRAFVASVPSAGAPSSFLPPV